MGDLNTSKGELAAFATREWTNIIAWTGNVCSSVLIVFCNKVLMGNKGYAFHFATTLSALHFLVCGTTVLLSQSREQNSEKRGKLPLKDLIIFTVVADASIISLNLSLLLNPVSTYQIAKLLVIPFVCLVEKFFLGSVFSREVLATIGLVVTGVAIVTVEEVNLEATVLGLSIAAASVVASGMQQILVRTLQQMHNLTSNDLLTSVALAQAASLLLLGPFVDKLVTGSWVQHYQWNVPAINFIVLSCVLAIGVNVTQFLCLGRFSAVSYQVLGHSKTILVLLGSCLFLGDMVSPKKLLGMVLAVVGMVLYGMASLRSKPAVVAPIVEKSKAGGGEQEALLEAGSTQQGSNQEVQHQGSAGAGV